MRNNFEGISILNGQFCSYTSKVSEVSRVSEVSKMSKQGKQQSLHSLLPLTLPSTNNPVDCLYERKGGCRPDEGADKSALTYGGTAKEAHKSTCPPLETLPNKNNPVDCFCERKPKSLISRRGPKNYDETRHEAAEPASCKSLVPQCPSALVTSKKAAFTLAEGRPACTTTLETVKEVRSTSSCSFAPWGEGDRRSDEGSYQCDKTDITPHQGRLASTNTQKITERNVSLNNALASGSAMVSENISFCSQSAIQHDGTRHKAAEPKTCNHLITQSLSHLITSQRAAFTLAEVLITLAVIGIVAALTLPGLIQNHNEKAWSTAKDLWEKKLTETVRRMNTDGVMTGHDSTEDFMDTFKQYMKVIKTCDNTDINKCYSPKVVTTGSNEEPMEVETDSLTSASSMGLKDWQTNTNTMSFVVADGTTVIMAYQPECPYADPIEDTGSQVSCMGYMVDVNGKKGPNRVGKDIQLSSGVAFSTCDNPIGDMCWSTEFTVTAINTCSDGTEEDKAYDQTGDSNSRCANNYWAGAKKACDQKNMSLPTRAQLAQLASELYVDSDGNAVEIAYNEDKSGLKLKDEYSQNPPIKYNGCHYWSSEEYGASGAYSRYFDTATTQGSIIRCYYKNSYGNVHAVCLGN